MCAFEKIRELVIWTGILVGEWGLSVQKRKAKKERDVKILLKNYVYTQ